MKHIGLYITLLSAGLALTGCDFFSEDYTAGWGTPSVTADDNPIINNLIANMVYVEGGTFTMGATSEQGSDVNEDEKPTHSVTLSSFSIGKYEVTQAEWQAVMGDNPSNSTGSNDLPVEQVSWDDCQTFITKLNALTGKNFRLPTEAEWEYAARGGNKSKGYKYAGSNTIGDVAWYYSNCRKTHAVGTKQPNELGLYDMSGNVYEWCSDRYGSYSSSSQTNPTGASSGDYRVFRGGSWDDEDWECRVSYRDNYAPEDWNDELGLRLVLEVESDKSTEDDATEDDATKIIDNLVNNMVYVVGGTFTMGATSEQGSDAYSNESPTHSVTLSDFSIGKYEVTQAEWMAVMGSNPSSFTGSDDLPVDSVSWDDCQTFITKLNTLTGKNFRLPTEAEWEYAARGGSKSKGYKYAGSNTIDDVAWYTSNSGSTTHAVGTKQPNELGLYDMSGNVWEWCSDWYGSYSSSAQTNPTGASSGSNRVFRGGSWSINARRCRVSPRNGNYPDFRNSYLGLRLVLEVESDKSTEEDATKIIDNLVNNMVYVAGGTFTMGATSEQGSDAYSDESPTHSVTLSSFSIGKYEVTQAEWQAVMGSNPSFFTGDDNLPVEQVCWDDCQTFITKLNALTGKTFRLPTEAEWEYAARGGSKSKGYKYAGSDNIDDVAWYESNSGDKTHLVGTKQPNELGLYDMSGNVWEWCSDWYGSYSSSSQTNPTGASSGSRRVIRGGGWGYSAWNCRVSDRDRLIPDLRLSSLGLRLVLEVESDKSTEDDATKVVLDNLVNNMVYVAGGTFTMGATSEQGSDAYSNESPTHSVTLSDFSIGKYEVTQAEWQAVMGSNPSSFTGSDDLPVDSVSWDDCQTFITKLNTLTGKNFRLPTEAEWEYAARGGSKSKGYKYAGSNNIGDVAWYSSNSDGKTHIIGVEQPNELGLYDMSGNVWEWCGDWHGSYSSNSQTNPTGASSGSYRVFRGGSWFNFARYCRVSSRGYGDPDFRDSVLGLRLALPAQL